QLTTIERMEQFRTQGKYESDFSPQQQAWIKQGEGYKVLNFTGHHINMVATHPEWQADPRNIAFLEKRAGKSHMTLGHPGGTRVRQPGSDLIDRQAMIDALPGGGGQ